MNGAYDIVKMLERAGLHVNGVDSEFVYLEEPGCVLRAFQSFLENAWLVLMCVTIMLISLWAISMITGAKNDIKNNFKTMVLIFGILTVAGPILNVIYGGDLFGATCGEIKVSIDEVNTIISTRAGANLDPSLYEDIDIYDSGAVQTSGSELPDVPDISALTEPDFSVPDLSNQ